MPPPPISFSRGTELGLYTTSMSDLAGLNSASKFTEAEFIALRVIWPILGLINDFPPLKDAELMEQAKDDAGISQG